MQTRWRYLYERSTPDNPDCRRFSLPTIEDLRHHLGKKVPNAKATSYRPVIALFSITLLAALAVSFTVYGTPFTMRAGGAYRLQHGHSGTAETPECRRLLHDVPEL